MHKGMFYHESMQVYAYLHSTFTINIQPDVSIDVLTAVSVTGGISEPAYIAADGAVLNR